MRIPLLLPSLMSVFLLGCAGDVSFWKYDNPEVRALQKTETDRHIGDGKEKKAMRDHIGARVGLVSTGSSDRPDSSAYGVPAGGRAAAVTADGYYLTAWHVVRDKPFFIETDLLKKPHPGRLVWSDPDADLALLKIAPTGGPFFKKMKATSPPGDIVFSADRKGRGVLAPDKNGTYDLRKITGNGSFFAAGKVLDSKGRDLGQGLHDFPTTLVARGGMSGAPVVTADGGLCGILSRIEWSVFHTRLRTIAVMIEPERLSDIIEKDRKKTNGSTVSTTRTVPEKSTKGAE
ncbi:trypsin-like peptidase domain-containing protein [Luteolibacter yonseiensis]|uniref:Trypsin-like peptidase domain-containing protein n=1 Tax=Luteolibacter yonseiensis TaxID=1144680 RepID=A0A934R2W4_9BACT|nr:serine protease [Luteolibacter yonseiensis]MBK1815864.1 trypsin-like peptidase domain-containing protein [Luteolibacter yonseiensis]